MTKSDVNSPEKRQGYNSIDVVKFLMAFAVIAIHTGANLHTPNRDLKNALGIVFKMAVPFFFMSTGYILYPKTICEDVENAGDTLKNYLLKIIRMYVTWTLIYTPLEIYNNIKIGQPIFKAIALYIRSFLFVGSWYNSWHLWYLLATIYAISVILLCKRKRLILVSLLGLILMTFTDYIVGYRGEIAASIFLIKKLLYYTVSDGRIFKGLIYIPIGMCIGKISDRKAKYRLVAAVALVAGFLLNMFIKSPIISEYALIVSSVGFFYLVTDINLKDSEIYRILRKMSTTIYFIHMYVFTIISLVLYSEIQRDFLMFLITSLISLIIALALCFAGNSRAKGRNVIVQSLQDK